MDRATSGFQSTTTPNTSDKYKSVPNFRRADDCVTISVVPEIKAPVRADRICRDMVAFDGQVLMVFLHSKNIIASFSRPVEALNQSW
jgi:hypothetical protein